jgi:hypothetical protein
MTGAYIVHVSTNTDQLQMSPELLLKLLCSRPYVQFLRMSSSVRVYAVKGVSSCCVVCNNVATDVTNCYGSAVASHCNEYGDSRKK